MTHLVLLGLGALIVVLTVVSCFGWLPSLRIVPDNTHFDFTRFRRISFPISAVLSIVAITLFFTHGLNFGIDFKGGTLLEVRAKSGAADIAAMRATLSGLGLGDVQLQQFGGPDEVLPLAEHPAGDGARQLRGRAGQACATEVLDARDQPGREDLQRALVSSFSLNGSPTWTLGQLRPADGRRTSPSPGPKTPPMPSPPVRAPYRMTLLPGPDALRQVDVLVPHHADAAGVDQGLPR